MQFSNRLVKDFDKTVDKYGNNVTLRTVSKTYNKSRDFFCFNPGRAMLNSEFTPF